MRVPVWWGRQNFRTNRDSPSEEHGGQPLRKPVETVCSFRGSAGPDDQGGGSADDPLIGPFGSFRRPASCWSSCVRRFLSEAGQPICVFSLLHFRYCTI